MSKIEWTDTTWNPLAGCTRASSGCDHCYAATMARRLEAMALKDIADGKDPGRKASYIGITTKTPNGNIAFNGKINLIHDAINQPFQWKAPRLVFVNSMSDLFHRSVPFHYIARVFEVMASTSRHTYQVLTKRPERMRRFYEEYPEFGRLPNIWCGTSTEDQHTADRRIPDLLQVPAAVRFLSCEPLLGPIDLSQWFQHLHWVIAGGESGPGARPMHPRWVESLRDQCKRAGVKFFFKQWGEWMPIGWECSHSKILITEAGELITKEEARTIERGRGYIEVKRVGKSAAGRLLDGRTWDEMPERS